MADVLFCRSPLFSNARTMLIANEKMWEGSVDESAVIRLTRDLAEAGRHLRVTLHDHIIVGASGHKSLRAEGLI